MPRMDALTEKPLAGAEFTVNAADNSTGYVRADELATAAQGAKADTAVQPADLEEINNAVSAKAANGANSDITSLSGLTTPLSAEQGGTGLDDLADLPISSAMATALGLKADFDRSRFTVADVATGQSATIPASAKSCMVQYYALADRMALSRANYKRVTAQPSHGLRFRSADRYLPDGTTSNPNGGWWEIDEEIIRPEFAGAKGDGSTDDTAAIVTALAAQTARGGIVRPGPKTYCVTSAIGIGNGDGSTTASATNGTKIMGHGAGFAVSGALVPTIFKWTGASGSSAYIFDVKGKISDVRIEGIYLQCDGKCNGIRAKAVSGSNFERVKIMEPREVGLNVLGGGTPVGNYNIFNRFSQISIGLTVASSIGLHMDGDFSVHNDTWISDFDLLRIDVVPGATNAKAAHFKFVDSCSFRRCHFQSSDEATSQGTVFDALLNNGFPSGMAFYDCSIDKTTVLEDVSNKIRKNLFVNHGTLDNEELPTHPNLVGITDTGLWFGPIGYVTGTGGAVTQLTDKSTSVTLNKLSGRITMVNTALAASTSVVFVFNNSFIGATDMVHVWIATGAAYASYAVGVDQVQNGLAVIHLRNVSSGSKSEAVVIGFSVMKAVAT